MKRSKYTEPSKHIIVTNRRQKKKKNPGQEIEKKWTEMEMRWEGSMYESHENISFFYSLYSFFLLF